MKPNFFNVSFTLLKATKNGEYFSNHGMKGKFPLTGFLTEKINIAFTAPY